MAKREQCFGVTIFMLAGFCFVMVFTLGNTFSSKRFSHTRIQPRPKIRQNPTMANFTTSRSQVYQLNGDIRIRPNSSTIFIRAKSSNWTVTPYARLHDQRAMAKSKSIKIISVHHHRLPHQPCRRLNVPAVVFSTGGHAGNPFHDFTDILVPLYSTSRQFNRSVVFLVSDLRTWWTSKYRLILKSLSKYDPIDIENGNETLCFSKMTVGLKADKRELSMDSISDFREFLRSTYSLDRREVAISSEIRPRLLLVSRMKTRHLTNEAQVAEVARGLGFDVEVREIEWQLLPMAKYVNSFDVLVGVHGAGLTNMVFLPDNGVVIQIVPVGLETFARIYFENPAREMRLKYLGYEVGTNESSLMGEAQHPLENKKGWHEFRSVYLDSQDVNVDLGRFRETLSKALELVRT